MWSRAWYGGARWLYLLWPLSLLFRLLGTLRAAYLRSRAVPAPLPTIVVGNISLGGTGKTPMVIALVEALRARGYRPAVVSRGYGASLPARPWRVTEGQSAAQTGDEALLIHERAGCPVVLDPDRPRAVAALADSGECDVIISDDGLQHYAMARQVEIVLVDAIRGFGNGLCLPAGPLREAPSRVARADHVVINGQSGFRLPVRPRDTVTHMRLLPTAWVNLYSGEERTPETLFANTPPHKMPALAGIGNPDRFFDLLTSLGYEVERHVFDDHHPYGREEVEAISKRASGPVVMTEKDAVKCKQYADERFWYLRVDAILDEVLVDTIDRSLQALSSVGQQDQRH